MRHLLLLIVLVVVAYTFWTLSDKSARKVAVKSITQHGLRLGFFIVVLLLLVVVATYIK